MLFVGNNQLLAQFVIKGRVLSADSNSVGHASIKIRGTKVGAPADSAGYYQFKTTIPGKQWLICSAIGYQKDSVLININGDFSRNFILKIDSGSFGVVKVSAGKPIHETKREYVLNDLDIATTAGSVADVAAALQTFPGAAPAGNETGIFIHGGSAEETKTFFDGMLVKNPFGSRLPDIANRSRYSAFLFEKTMFTTSGYNPEYGQAMSSAMLWDTKGLADTTSTEFSLVSLGIGAAHTQRFKSSSLTVGANYYNYALNNSVVKQNVAWQMDPRQYQSMIHWKIKTSPTGMFKLFADYSDTQLSFKINNPIKNQWELLSNTNRNWYVNAHYTDYVFNSWKLFAGVAFNNTAENGSLVKDPYHQHDNVWQEKISLSKEFFKNSLFTVGAEQFQSQRNEGFAQLQRGYNDVLSAAFAQQAVYITKNILVDAGLRAERSNYLNRNNLAPRTSLSYIPSKAHKITGSFGSYYEKPDDSFLSQTDQLTFEKANNYALEYTFTNQYKNLRVQFFHKQYSDLTKIITPVFSGFQAFGPPLQISAFNNSGSGYAKGIDVFWHDVGTFNALEYYISYSYIDTKRNFIDYPAAATPPFVSKHTGNLVAKKLIMNYRAQVSATYTFSSGRSYFNPLNTVFMGDRTQANHNISLGFSYLPHIGRSYSAINLTVGNIFGFKQVYSYRYSYDGARRVTVYPPSGRNILLAFLINLDGGNFNH
ncbi:TonB-dependent receptor [Mucilaginibacter conchicola]|uniref:TonB-dependent receptor n=1 Tax=Mucilaginibacter conchicola TaxID=2303333 RepID=A0A372NPR7_9SPHI|nr:TonB-dependent receptor [Mucilaginibacter conchicola]RFZ90934.1 TonB-dependent receptor [Mucilaginibacter conchicola]